MKNLFKLFRKLKSEEELDRDWHKTACYKEHKAIKDYWTPELIEWVGNETSPVKLSVAACLLNTGKHPKFMPFNIANFSLRCNGDPIFTHFICDLIRMLSNKSNLISPGLYDKIWISKYYESFWEKNK